MKTQYQQQQANISRLQAYRAKQNPMQRRRADIAEKVSSYAKKLDLSLLQTSEAIRRALSMIDIGFTEVQALKTGVLAADLIAKENAKQLNGQSKTAYLLH